LALCLRLGDELAQQGEHVRLGGETPGLLRLLRLLGPRAPIEGAVNVAGGRTREDRARRAEVALYARGRVLSEGWPDLWILAFFAAADATVCASRRARGLRRLTVEETCAGVEPPDAPPPPRRTTKKQREANRKEKLAERLRKLASEVEKLDELGPVSW
jgi:hypothetical protein